MAEDIRKNRLYRIWCNMKSRCLTPSSTGYHKYGGRGIKVCERWLKFNNFKEDMERDYRDALTLDRINNEKGYYKQNCRWVSYKQQNNNRRDNRWLSFKGKTHTIPQWADLIGIKYSTLKQRYYVHKWSIDRCLGEI